MTTLDDLVAVASVGTSRKQVALGGLEGAVGEALGTLEKQAPSVEAKLLAAVAVLARYEACGRIPVAAGDPGEPAAAEALAACSRRAGDLLGQILAMTNTPTKDQLLGEWLTHASRKKRRAPWRSLPALLDYGAAHRARRAAIVEAAGTRGAWLMRQNPRWQNAATEQDDPRALWETGTREQRIAALGRVRQSDPAAARELIRETWAEDAAEDRAAFVAATATSLSDADEAFLESALDDRSKQVRAAAAELLARLPNSGLVRRMVERAEPLIALKMAGKGRSIIEITLPADKFDPSWARDGVVEKPEGRMGRRQWWLMQMVGAIPPAHWSSKWGLSSQECIAAARGEFADVLIEGWHVAAGRNPDPAWVAALLLAAAKEERGPLTLSLLGHLPDDAREAILAEILESKKGGIEQAIEVLREGTFPLGKQSAAALFARVERQVAQQKGGYDYAVGQVLEDAACRVPPEFHDELAGRWLGDRWEQNRKARDGFLQILQLRRDIKRELEAGK
jgi:hypothetical protein